MAKRALPLLTGGLNDVARSDLIEDSQLQECLNYEISGDGVLKKRTEQEEYSSEINELLEDLFDEVISISEPYYFQTEITSEKDYSPNTIIVKSDFILLVFGIKNDTYELQVLYEIKTNGISSWTYGIHPAPLSLLEATDSSLTDLLKESGVFYSENSDVQFTNTDNKIIITDNVNKAHFIKIDSDGIFRTGLLGFDAPTNKAKVTQLTEWNSDLFEETSTDSRMSQIGLFQCVYTVVSKYGEESNPSPLSDTLDMQFFKISANGADERWIDNVSISDLSVPNLSASELEDLKYFNVYMRVFRYSEGVELQTLDFTQQFKIIDKSSINGETGNSYVLTVEVDSGNSVSYENDVAPIAKTSAYLGGITMLGNVQTKIKFPHDFKYYHPITIENKDNKHYVDAIVKIKLYDGSASVDEAIENFNISDFFSGYNLVHINTNYIRLYDEDSTTPLMVGWKREEGVDNPEYVNLFIKIPLLTASSSKVIYLCFTDEQNMELYNGVPSVYNDIVSGDTTFNGNLGIHYGRIMHIGHHSWKRQQIWSESRVRNANSLIISPLEFSNDSKLLNKSNTNINGSYNDSWITTSYSYGDNLPTYFSNISRIVQFEDREDDNETDNKRYNIGLNSIYTINNQGKIEFDFYNGLDGSGNTFGEINMSKGFVSSLIEFRPSLIPSGDDLSLATGNAHFFCLNAVEGNLEIKVTLGLDKTDEDVFIWAMKLHIFHVLNPQEVVAHYNIVSIHNVQPFPVYGIDDSNIYRYNLLWTWDFNQLKSKLYLKDNGDSGNLYSTITLLSDDYHDSDYDFRTDIINSFIIGTTSYPTAVHPIPTFTSIDNLIVENGFYVEELEQVVQLWNFQPMYDNVIGEPCYNENNVYNQNIEFSKTEEVKYKSDKNMLKWTDVNGKAFPDLFFKKVKEPIVKIMPAPSFLQFEYQNTFIIFTRNSINRFILSGSASGWGGSSSSLIEEKQQYGLLAEKSLVRAGDILFWLSEVGVVKWDGNDGLQLITKNILNIPINSSLIGYYVPLKNQYILHDTSSSISYVYHIDRGAWTKFSGLDVKQSITLTGGSQLENINLYLKTNLPSIDYYPTETYTTSDSVIKTKNMFFEKGVLKRMKADYSGDNKQLQSTIENMVGIEKIHSVNSESEEWRGIPLGKNRGKSLNFTINNADTISAIMYELDIESEVKI